MRCVVGQASICKGVLRRHTLLLLCSAESAEPELRNELSSGRQLANVCETGMDSKEKARIRMKGDEAGDDSRLRGRSIELQSGRAEDWLKTGDWLASTLTAESMNRVQEFQTRRSCEADVVKGVLPDRW